MRTMVFFLCFGVAGCWQSHAFEGSQAPAHEIWMTSFQADAVKLASVSVSELGEQVKKGPTLAVIDSLGRGMASADVASVDLPRGWVSFRAREGLGA